MKRIDTAGRAIDLFGAGKPGFKEGNPATDDPPTIVDASWPNHVQEEIARAIEGFGIALDGAKYDQLLTALKRGGLVSALVTFNADAALDDANFGKLHIYTGAGGHTFSWTNAAKPGLNFEIVNLGSGNLTLNPDGAEEIDNVASIVLAAGQSVRVRRISDSDAIVTAARGYGGVSGNVAYLDAVQAFTRAQRYTPVALVDGASIAWDLDVAPMAKVTLGGNRTMAAPTNQRDGGMFVLEVTQDGTGNRTLAWNVAFEFGVEGTPIQPTTAGKKTIYVFLSDGAAMRCVGRWEN